MNKTLITNELSAMLYRKILDTPPPPILSIFLHFYAVFGKFWPNNRLEPPFRLPFPLWEILDPPLQRIQLTYLRGI